MTEQHPTTEELVTTDRPHVVVVNRWRERYAEFTRYVDHAANRVTYVSTEVGTGSVPAEAHEVVLVPATDDLTRVGAEVRALAARHGAPAAIVALKEDDLLVGAALREEWDVPGPRQASQIAFRDKYLMCRAVADAGLDVPAFTAATDADAVLDFAAGTGWPVIVKPRTGSSSAGVVRVDGPEQVADLDLDGEPMLVQAFVDAPVSHVDGVFDGGRLLAWRASRYLNTCLGFRGGSFLGSVEIDDPEVNTAVEHAATAFLGALSPGRATVFHLEVFIDRDEDGGVVCRFLECGARVGGAEIAFLWREVHDYDLMHAAWQLQVGGALPPVPEAAAAPHAGGEVAGWMLVPAPAERPCRITESTSMTGRADGPYAEAVLPPGEVLPDADAYYEHVGGRFRFRAATAAAAEAAVTATARDFRVRAEPLALSTTNA
ncbi:biotin carboxylase [Streptomyces sp. SP17BM10]|uniref:ATP-grasp domain-containing protein n=1 Tax=Streptomyces sp. SP17BM10 TaxID=3002530 RepID=UPI002E78903A|nr:biotin carboxylase [Streptomyces sp. SP17BM10]MEE1783424.1 biotin carboxylase [Streptomyces sp. SP17BM10]